MIHSFQSIIDALFPPSADHQLLRTHTAHTFRAHYTPTTTDADWALSQYLDRTIQAAVKECKFHNNRHAGRLLASLLTTWLATQPPVPTVLIPIPLSRKRLRTRGYNQVATVCSALPTLPHITVAPQLLVRQRDTAPQTSLTRADRLTNVSDAFSVPDSQRAHLSQYEHIIICDDVLTTGATLMAARAAITPYLAPQATLTTIAWAH